MILLKSAISNLFTILFGIIVFIVSIALLVYFKMFLAKIFNVNMINNRGRVVIKPDSFDNVNAYVTEKVVEKFKPSTQNQLTKHGSISQEDSDTNKTLKKFLTKDKTISIINSRRTINKNYVNQRCILKVVEVGKETYLDNGAKRKLIRCDINSKYEMDKLISKKLLKAALEAESCNNSKEAHLLYQEYLNTIQFRFSLFDNSILYYVIRAGDVIEGNIEFYEGHGIEFLTVNSKSVNYRRL